MVKGSGTFSNKTSREKSVQYIAELDSSQQFFIGDLGHSFGEINSIQEYIWNQRI